MLSVILYFLAGELALVGAYVLLLRALDRWHRSRVDRIPLSDGERRMLAQVAGANDIGLPFSLDCKAGREFGPDGLVALSGLVARRLIYAVHDEETQDGYCLTTAGEQLVEGFPERHPGRERKYGMVSTSRKGFHPGEPVFVLRSTDPLAPDAVKSYALRCELAKCSPQHSADVREVARLMREWQEKHPELVKTLPD